MQQKPIDLLVKGLAVLVAVSYLVMLFHILPLNPQQNKVGWTVVLIATFFYMLVTAPYYSRPHSKLDNNPGVMLAWNISIGFFFVFLIVYTWTRNIPIILINLCFLIFISIYFAMNYLQGHKLIPFSNKAIRIKK